MSKVQVGDLGLGLKLKRCRVFQWDMVLHSARVRRILKRFSNGPSLFKVFQITMINIKAMEPQYKSMEM